MRENIQFHPERETTGRLSRGGSGTGTASRVRMYVLPPPRAPAVIEYSIGFTKAGRGAVAWRHGMARMRRSTGHTPIFDPRQKLRGGSIQRQRADFQRGSLTPCAPAAVSPPQRVILSLPSGRLNFRKAIIPDLPEIIDCIFVYGEGQRARAATAPPVAASLFDRNPGDCQSAGRPRRVAALRR